MSGCLSDGSKQETEWPLTTLVNSIQTVSVNKIQRKSKEGETNFPQSLIHLDVNLQIVIKREAITNFKIAKYVNAQNISKLSLKVNFTHKSWN